MVRKAWAWFRSLKPWQQILLALAVGFALLKAWDLAGLLLAGALDVDRIAGRARGAARSISSARRRAKAISRTADAAGDLLDAVGDLGEAHRAADAEHDAAIDAADADAAASVGAEPPADDLEPMRFKSLGER